VDEDEAPVPARDGEKPGKGKGRGEGEDDEDEAMDAGGLLLPLLEHSPSHLLFKRLLQRESLPREGDAASASASAADAAALAAEPVFGPILMAHLAAARVRLASLVTSNRAAFVVVELARSRLAQLRAAALAQLAEDAAQLRGREQSPGLALLLQVVDAGAGKGAAKAPAAAPGGPTKPDAKATAKADAKKKGV